MDLANTQEMDTEAASSTKDPPEDALSSKPPLWNPGSPQCESTSSRSLSDLLFWTSSLLPETSIRDKS